MAYLITQNYITYNRSNEPLNAEGMVVHSTATPGATDENEQNFYNTGNRQASSHAFIDWDSITETVPDTEVAWGSGYTSNHKFLQVELCEPKTYNLAQFTEVWNRGVWYFAYKFVNKLKINTVTKDNLMSHAEVSAKWHETNHTDPVGYFAQYGKTVDQFRSEVQEQINIMIAPSQPISQPSSEIFRVRKTWEDVKSQIGAFTVLSSAKALVDKNPGYKAFNEKGEVIYSVVQSVPQMQPISQPKPTQFQGNSNVRALQALCNILGVRDQNGNTLTLDGILGDKTRYAVSHLPLCGLSYTQRIATRYVQTRLGISVDGIFGNQTSNYLKSWQSRHGLQSDGICGSQTWLSFLN